MSSYVREIKFIGGYDWKNDPDKSKRKYGMNTPGFLFIVRNGKGAITLDIATKWYTQEHIDHYGPWKWAISANLASHTPLPSNPLELVDKTITDCDIIHQKCIGNAWYAIDERWNKLVIEGSTEHLFSCLEKWHKHIYHDEPWDPNCLNKQTYAERYGVEDAHHDF